MNLSELRAEIRTSGGFSATDDFYTDAILDTLINQALRHVSLQEDWPWLEDSQTVTIDSNNPNLDVLLARKIRWVRVDDRNVPLANFRANPAMFASDVKGPPLAYVSEAMTWRVLPTPDKSYTVDVGFVKETDNELVAPTDEPLLPGWAIDLLVTWTMVLITRRGRDRENQSVWFAQYRETLSRIRDEITRSTEGFLPLKTRRYRG